MLGPRWLRAVTVAKQENLMTDYENTDARPQSPGDVLSNASSGDWVPDFLSAPGYSTDVRAAKERIERSCREDHDENSGPFNPSDACVFQAEFFGYGPDHDGSTIGPHRYGVDGIWYAVENKKPKKQRDRGDVEENGDESDEPEWSWYWLCDFFTIYGSGIDPNTRGEVLVICHLSGDRWTTVQTSIPREVVAKGGRDLAGFLAARGLVVSTELKERNILQRLLSRLRGPRILMPDRSGCAIHSLSSCRRVRCLAMLGKLRSRTA
jgi:hypothetical protein